MLLSPFSQGPKRLRRPVNPGLEVKGSIFAREFGDRVRGGNWDYQ
jgi:hypothetical protein